MKLLKLVAYVLTIALFGAERASAQPQQEAPFGLVWGMSAEQARAQGIELKSAPSMQFGVGFAATNLPKAIADQEVTYLSFGFDDKLWRIAALSRSFDSDPHGNKVLSRYTELSELLAEKYGKGKRVHEAIQSTAKANISLLASMEGEPTGSPILTRPICTSRSESLLPPATAQSSVSSLRANRCSRRSRPLSEVEKRALFSVC
jgi:hypothetical protein